jgi:hypothetical protein
MRTSGSPILRAAALAALVLGSSGCADHDRDYYPREPTHYDGRYYGGYYGPLYDYYGYRPGYLAPPPYAFVRPRRHHPPHAAQPPGPPPAPPPDRGPGGVGGLVGRLAPPGIAAGAPPPRPPGPPPGPPPGSGGGGIGGIVGRLAPPPGGGRPQRPSD